MTENNESSIKNFANGNLVVLKIVEEEGKGLIINWVRSDIEPTLIDCVGKEKPLYDHIKKLYPDLSKATGAGLAIGSDEKGFVESIGKINDEKVSVEKNETSK